MEWAQIRSHAVVAIIAAVVAAALVWTVEAVAQQTENHDNHDAFVYSGCFHRGKITKIRIRDAKPERCETIATDSVFGHARYVTWSAQGPQGEPGEQGIQGPQGQQGPQGDNHFGPFRVALDAPDGGFTDQVVFTYETVTVTARCIDNEPGEGDGTDRGQLLVTSSEDGWYHEEDSGTAQAAGTEVIGSRVSFDDGFAYFDNDIDDFVMVTPAGHTVGWDGESTGIGLNIFGSDCLLSGNPWGVTE